MTEQQAIWDHQQRHAGDDWPDVGVMFERRSSIITSAIEFLVAWLVGAVLAAAAGWGLMELVTRAFR